MEMYFRRMPASPEVNVTHATLSVFIRVHPWLTTYAIGTIESGSATTSPRSLHPVGVNIHELVGLQQTSTCGQTLASRM